MLIGDDEPPPDLPLSEDDIRQIIQKEMEKQGEYLKPDAPRRLRFYTVKGLAWFKCTKNHSKLKKMDDEYKYKYWYSPHAWCVIDLKLKKISKKPKYLQGCKQHWFKDKPEPTFTKAALEKMAEYAVKSLKFRRYPKNKMPGNLITDRESTAGRGRHEEQLCGMCRKWRRSCWKKRVAKT